MKTHQIKGTAEDSKQKSNTLRSINPHSFDTTSCLPENESYNNFNGENCPHFHAEGENSFPMQLIEHDLRSLNDPGVH